MWGKRWREGARSGSQTGGTESMALTGYLPTFEHVSGNRMRDGARRARRIRLWRIGLSSDSVFGCPKIGEIAGSIQARILTIHPPSIANPQMLDRECSKGVSVSLGAGSLLAPEGV